ncbi:hypothetical protein I2494_18010 [Budviciaceae bacterium BWR-B9]|uniref:Uncharacterized protein n=1 Tax=Limnobaculum allomyrinae TaxID=2791986 RepID=A0ABS1IV67_9GAMM|nr:MULTISPECIES: hypothetical protein [Limnobaculum]MBK5145577.1 hypothetical protein [Limnobaculum allomyrinae]MBV7693695.1 hypothetical protein [Limnobaculum sp. M2-1]
MLSLLDSAELNQIKFEFPTPHRTKTDGLNSIRAVTEQEQFIHGRHLNEIIFFDPWIQGNRLEARMHDLETDRRPWPSGRAKTFYQILMTENVTQEEVTFIGRYGDVIIRPERRVRINGETEGNRPPYWVILMYQRDAAGEVVCREAYAHAFYNSIYPVPVDSELERQTIQSITKTAQWLKERNYTFTITKPLFDIEVNVKEEIIYVLPDFLLSVDIPGQFNNKNFVIETMGYDNEDYTERKAFQHTGMQTLGLLLTDPPRWPEESPWIDAFTKYLFGHVINA